MAKLHGSPVERRQNSPAYYSLFPGGLAVLYLGTTVYFNTGSFYLFHVDLAQPLCPYVCQHLGLPEDTVLEIWWRIEGGGLVQDITTLFRPFSILVPYLHSY